MRVFALIGLVIAVLLPRGSVETPQEVKPGQAPRDVTTAT